MCPLRNGTFCFLGCKGAGAAVLIALVCVFCSHSMQCPLRTVRTESPKVCMESVFLLSDSVCFLLREANLLDVSC